MGKAKPKRVVRAANANGTITLNVNLLGYLWKVLAAVIVIGGYIWYQATWQATVDARLGQVQANDAKQDEHLKELDRYFYRPGGTQ